MRREEEEEEEEEGSERTTNGEDDRGTWDNQNSKTHASGEEDISVVRRRRAIVDPSC